MEAPPGFADTLSMMLHPRYHERLAALHPNLDGGLLCSLERLVTAVAARARRIAVPRGVGAQQRAHGAGGAGVRRSWR